MRATIRGVVAGYTSRELYDTAARASIALALFEKVIVWIVGGHHTEVTAVFMTPSPVQIRDDMSTRGILIEAVPLRAIHLPKRVSESIENKLRMEQENERMVRKA